jgi:cobalt-zinc-cadmium resistance protein CzcA
MLLLMVSSYFTTATAQVPKIVSLNEAIQIALDRNLSLRSAKYSVEEQKALKGASWDIPKTVIEGQYGQFNSYQKDNSFAVSQTFAFPTVYINQNDLSKANIKSADWQYNVSRLEVSTQVKQVYWQLGYLYSRKRLLLYQDSLYSGFLRAAELRAKTGETNRLEMITARTQSLEIKNQLQQVMIDLSIHSRKLKSLLNSETGILPSDTILHRIDFTPVNDSLALIANPSLGYVRQQVNVSKIAKRLETSRIMPDLTIGYFSQTILGTQEINGIPRAFDADYRFTGLQAGIAIPLWFGPTVSKSKAAKMQEQVSISNADYYVGSLRSNYSSLLDEYRKYSSSVAYYEQQAIPEANMIIEQSSQSYKAGALDYLDYVINLNRALSIKQNYLDAINSYNQTIINIDYITGKIY